MDLCTAETKQTWEENQPKSAILPSCSGLLELRILSPSTSCIIPMNNPLCLQHQELALDSLSYPLMFSVCFYRRRQLSGILPFTLHIPLLLWRCFVSFQRQSSNAPGWAKSLPPPKWVPLNPPSPWGARCFSIHGATINSGAPWPGSGSELSSTMV